MVCGGMVVMGLGEVKGGSCKERIRGMDDKHI